MTNPIPSGFHTVTPQLTIRGAAQAIDFYKKAFGAQELDRAADPSGEKVWHATLLIGTSRIMVNDEFPESQANKTRLWLYVEDVDASFARATAAGCSVRMPAMDMFWGDRIASVSDPFGNDFTIATHVKDMTPAEMKAAQDAFVAAMANRAPTN